VHKNNTGGQATVEYLIVALAIIVIIAALSLLANAIGSGMFVEHAADSASHSMTTNTAGSIGDVLLY
jgi:Flp pilus assembly pilin Flp